MIWLLLQLSMVKVAPLVAWPQFTPLSEKYSPLAGLVAPKLVPFTVTTWPGPAVVGAIEVTIGAPARQGEMVLSLRAMSST